MENIGYHAEKLDHHGMGDDELVKDWISSPSSGESPSENSGRSATQSPVDSDDSPCNYEAYLLHKPRGSKGVWVKVKSDDRLRVTKGKGKRLKLEIHPGIDGISTHSIDLKDVRVSLVEIDKEEVPVPSSDYITLSSKHFEGWIELEIKLFKVGRKLQFIVILPSNHGPLPIRSIIFGTRSSGASNPTGPMIKEERNETEMVAQVLYSHQNNPPHPLIGSHPSSHTNQNLPSFFNTHVNSNSFQSPPTTQNHGHPSSYDHDENLDPYNHGYSTPTEQNLYSTEEDATKKRKFSDSDTLFPSSHSKNLSQTPSSTFANFFAPPLSSSSANVQSLQHLQYLQQQQQLHMKQKEQQAQQAQSIISSQGSYVSPIHPNPTSVTMTTPTIPITTTPDGNVTIVNSGLDVRGVVRAKQFLQFSDLRLKTNIEDVVGALQIVTSLQGKKYEWKGEHNNISDDPGGLVDLDQNPTNSRGRKTIGLIAQEVKKILPEVVKEDPITGYLSVSYTELLPIIIEAFKELMSDFHSSKHDVNSQLEELNQKVDLLSYELQQAKTPTRSVSFLKALESVKQQVKQCEQSVSFLERDANTGTAGGYGRSREIEKLVKSKKIKQWSLSAMFIFSLILFVTGSFLTGLALIFTPTTPDSGADPTFTSTTSYTGGSPADPNNVIYDGVSEVDASPASIMSSTAYHYMTTGYYPPNGTRKVEIVDPLWVIVGVIFVVTGFFGMIGSAISFYFISCFNWTKKRDEYRQGQLIP